jgi:hypothetical protein
VRTIVLSIHAIENKEMQAMLSHVPYCTFYAHLACHLRDSWILMDRVIEATQQGSQSHQVAALTDSLLKRSADINDTLLFISDLYNVMHERGLT